MKNFYQYIPPFAPDYSGAAAVFYGIGALIVICDPGGCSGNVCGYDEPRFYKNGGAIYSAALRDMDTILGRDDKLVEKIIKAAQGKCFPLIALIGTPVISVIGTDLEALCSMIEKETGIRTVSVDTNGMEFYDAGQKKARNVLEKTFPGKYTSSPTPLDSMPEEKTIIKIADEADEVTEKILIVHQHEAADAVRKELLRRGHTDVTTGSWFKGCDLRFKDETLFIEECMNYDAVIADPLYFRALKEYPGKKISFPHLAVSGDLFSESLL